MGWAWTRRDPTWSWEWSRPDPTWGWAMTCPAQCVVGRGRGQTQRGVGRGHV